MHTWSLVHSAHKGELHSKETQMGISGFFSSKIGTYPCIQELHKGGY